MLYLVDLRSDYFNFPILYFLHRFSAQKFKSDRPLSTELYLHLAERPAGGAAFALHAGRNYELARNTEKATESYLFLLGRQTDEASNARELAAWRLGRLERGELFSLPPPPPPKTEFTPGTESEIPDERAPADDEKKSTESENSP